MVLSGACRALLEHKKAVVVKKNKIIRYLTLPSFEGKEIYELLIMMFLSDVSLHLTLIKIYGMRDT
jgi:hypothetical protein